MTTKPLVDPCFVCTLVLLRGDRERLLSALEKAFGTPKELKGNRTSWKRSKFKMDYGDAQFTVQMKARPGDEFSRIILGLWSFVRDARIGAKVKKSLQATILDTEMLVGVVVSDLRSDDLHPFLVKVFDVLGNLDGLLFDGSQLVDATGNVLIG